MMMMMFSCVCERCVSVCGVCAVVMMLMLMRFCCYVMVPVVCDAMVTEQSQVGEYWVQVPVPSSLSSLSLLLQRSIEDLEVHFILTESPPHRPGMASISGVGQVGTEG
jgi:hypothetical protein